MSLINSRSKMKTPPASVEFFMAPAIAETL